MSDFEFSDAFLNIAFKALLFSGCETEEDKRQFGILCEVCDKYKIPVKAFMEASAELDERLCKDD